MQFQNRHIGPTESDQKKMLEFLGLDSKSSLIDKTLPTQIRSQKTLDANPQSEFQALASLRNLFSENKVFKSYMGQGYFDTVTPAIIARNILENPGWYTQYTPYQAEISQGRLEALLNFQTMVCDLTAMQIANASMLDEATAAAEAMVMCFTIAGRPKDRAFFVSRDCYAQTLAVLETRAKPLGIRIIIGNPFSIPQGQRIFGALVQYPDALGSVSDFRGWADKMHAQEAMVCVATDLLALTLLKPPGEWGADIVVGSTQRFGVPMGFGGPHAAFLATRDEHKRLIPGRLVGVSKDVDGNPGIRLALQTREQHIRRDKATSNICTAQVLLAIMASMYAVYHGPKGLTDIAKRIHSMASKFAEELLALGFELENQTFFDTLSVRVGQNAGAIIKEALTQGINLFDWGTGTLSVSFDEAKTDQDFAQLVSIFKKFGTGKGSPAGSKKPGIQTALTRDSKILTHPVFNLYHSETEMLRYIKRLESKDLSLAYSMIPLGSCTMKLNATTEMLPVSWPEVSQVHPFAPRDQVSGYLKMLKELERDLCEITGFDAVSLQPNAGSQGEYAGLLVIQAYHASRGEPSRDVCLIPSSAHGTNPASAAMAGMRVIVVACDASGNIDVEDLKRKAIEHRAQLSSLMVTYPSTHGVFEESIKEICEIVHQNGGQVYMDGANMNAQVGLCFPGSFGPDVCHLNLHKTFCIPHGGGGPGMGPIGVRSHLAPFLPSHPIFVKQGGNSQGIGPVSAAPYGSPSILPISYLYIKMMGGRGLKDATEVAILNANYLAKKLDPHFPVLFKGKNGFVAHECIVDLRPIKATSGIEVEDVAKRLMDYGFHAPTVSFPVPGTLMIEPTESESLTELDRFVEAMVKIREEIRAIESGKMDRANNPLKNAPHTAAQVTKSEWNRPYSREEAVFPTRFTREAKFWPPIGRIDQVYGERNLFCTCPPLQA